MTLIVEDGSIVTDANTYASDVEADNYFTYERPSVEDWCTFSDDQKEAALRFGTKLLDDECWLGLRVSPSTQALAWPRANVWDADRLQYFKTNEIPQFLKCALFELAVSLGREDRTLTQEAVGGGQGIERVKIDVLEIEWADRAVAASNDTKPLIPDIVKKFICPYVESCGDGIAVKILRT